MQFFRQDRILRMLNGVVSIAFFGLLFLGVVVLLGLPVVKLAAGDNSHWLLGLPVPVAPLESEAAVLTRWGDARLEVQDMQGTLRLPVSILPWSIFAVAWTNAALAMGLILVFLHHLRAILQHVRAGAAFDASNARRLRWLGLLVLTLAALSSLSGLLTSLVVRGGLISGHVEVPRGLSVDASLVFFGLVLLALAEVFRQGARLEAEQSLTV